VIVPPLHYRRDAAIGKGAIESPLGLAVSDEEIGDLLEGRGMGLAKAAELNSYPGPLRVLQLADELGLSEAQRKATDALHANVRQRARSL
jgi:hypothetical protein